MALNLRGFMCNLGLKGLLRRIWRMIPTFRNWRVGCKFATITAVCHSCLRRTQLPLSSRPLPFPLFPQLLAPPSVHQYPPLTFHCPVGRSAQRHLKKKWQSTTSFETALIQEQFLERFRNSFWNKPFYRILPKRDLYIIAHTNVCQKICQKCKSALKC